MDSEFFSYRTKYGSHGFEVGFPTGEPVLQVIETLSRKLASTLGFHTMCRFDFIVDQMNRVYLLEVNPLPGLLASSIYPKLLARAGYTISDLIAFSHSNDEIYQRHKMRENTTVGVFRVDQQTG